LESKKKILIVEDEAIHAMSLKVWLTRLGYDVFDLAATGEQALEKVSTNPPPDLILIDISLRGDMDGIELAEIIKERFRIPFVFLTAYSTKSFIARAKKTHPLGYILKPFQEENLRVVIEIAIYMADQNNQKDQTIKKAHEKLEEKVKQRTIELAKTNQTLSKEIEHRKRIEAEIKRSKEKLEIENVYLKEEIELQHEHREIIGQSHAIKAVLNRVEQVAGTQTTVLIQGETGTGKELIAREVHHLSKFNEKLLVKVNCAALPPTLIEGELFGREKGAYTGALSKQSGRFELASGSSIFLDEISELPLDLQPKLLRVLQDGEFERLGSSKTIKTNVRVIAATNRDLVKEMKKARFRNDLFYRLYVFPILVPPLRERTEDIPLLVWAIVKELEKKLGKRVDTITEKSMNALKRYAWPGNVREMRNIVEMSMILSKGSKLDIQLPGITENHISEDMSIQSLEYHHIQKVLDMTGWRVSGKKGAAQILGLKPTTLEYRMKKLDIKRQ
jgi:DNA-binding NtrC family response regulator